MAQVASNPNTTYRVRGGFARTYTELHLDAVGLAELDTATLGPDAATYTYTDIVDDVVEIEIQRGRARSTDRPQADTARVTLLDRDRDYDPENTASPYYGNIVPGRPFLIQARVGIGGTWRTLYTGLIRPEGVTYRLMPGGYQVCQLALITSLQQLANQALTADTAFGAESSAARFAALVALADPAPATSSDATGETVEARTETAGTTLGQLLFALNDAEAGALYIAQDGTLTFRSRYSTLNVPAAVSLTPDQAGIQYATLDVQHADEVYPLVQVTDSAGDVQSAQNRANQLDYPGVLAVNPGGLLDATGAQDLADTLLGRYQAPQTNVRSVEVYAVAAALTNANLDRLVNLELRDAVEVVRSYQVGAPLTLTDYYVVESIAHRISRAEHLVTVGFGSRSSDGWFALDSAAFGVLDSPALIA